MTTKLTAALILAFIAGCTNVDQNPVDTEGVVLPKYLPSESPDNWVLAHIDVETTGLIPGYHEMIDIGLVYTTLEGRIIDSMFLRIQPEHPERLAPGAQKVNAYDPEAWEKLSAVSPLVAVDSISNFHNSVVGNRSALMIAYNSWFDAAFLDHLFRSAHKTWRHLFYYFILDIPSMAWSLGFRDLTGQELLDKYQIADEPHIAQEHTGITGAMLNVRIYQALIKPAQSPE